MINRFIFKIVDNLINFHQKSIYNKFRQKYEIDETFRFNGNNIIFGGKGRIIIGKNSYLGIGSSISTNSGYFVEIGENCAISHNVRIYNNSYEADGDFNLMPRKLKFGNVKIGNGVWIGSNVVILPNVEIGANSIVGANSVVVKDVVQNSISSGIPCNLIRMKKNVN
jgi:maltose O-acetyltransferase